MTDIDGNYSLKTKKTLSSKDLLLFSYVGYKTLQKNYTGNTMNVKLAEESQQLNDVVVTALGIKREEKGLGYATETVKGDKITSALPSNWSTALNGKVAGLSVISSGGPLNSSRISLRGDRKMRYFEADLKSERPVYGSNGEIKQVLPSREDSLDRLMEENARQFAAAAESVEDVVIRKLAVDKLHTALMQLTKEERDFICALFFDEKTESEVAKGLGVSQQAVHKRKNRILKKLKNFFE